MIKVIEHKKVEKIDDIGDILYPDEGDKWYSKIPEEFYTEKLYLPLSVNSLNPWTALDELGIDCKEFKEKIKYKCPYTNYEHFWFVPIIIFTDDVKFWIDKSLAGSYKYMAEMYLDKDYMKGRYVEQDIRGYKTLLTTSIHGCLLGTGYTHCTMAHDGDGRTFDTLVALDNGDYLGGKVWVWFNK